MIKYNLNISGRLWLCLSSFPESFYFLYLSPGFIVAWIYRSGRRVILKTPYCTGSSLSVNQKIFCVYISCLNLWNIAEMWNLWIWAMISHDDSIFYFEFHVKHAKSKISTYSSRNCLSG